jgi:hypothetical protein
VRPRCDRQSTTEGASTSSVLRLALAATVAAPTLALPARSAIAQASPAQMVINFDIPAQPLPSALERYGDATGREVLYESGTASDRRSAPVKGRLTPEAALHALLDGTGLAARFMADGTFVLVPLPAAGRQDHAAPLPVQQRYYARIQSRLREALCAKTEVRPGSYRLVALFWIGSAGTVSRYERLGSTGQSLRDRDVDLTLTQLAIGEPPPTGFEQPVLIMIVPERPGVTLGCETGAPHGRAP